MNLEFIKKHNDLNIYVQFQNQNRTPFNVVVLDMKTNRFEIMGEFDTPNHLDVIDEFEDVFEGWDD
jgi:hypothetical protein